MLARAHDGDEVVHGDGARLVLVEVVEDALDVALAHELEAPHRRGEELAVVDPAVAVRVEVVHDRVDARGRVGHVPQAVGERRAQLGERELARVARVDRLEDLLEPLELLAGEPARELLQRELLELGHAEVALHARADLRAGRRRDRGKGEGRSQTERTFANSVLRAS